MVSNLSQHANQNGSNNSHYKNENSMNNNMSKKAYIESKSNGGDISNRMSLLDKYTNELVADIMNIMQDTHPEEKQMVRNKLTSLVQQMI